MPEVQPYALAGAPIDTLSVPPIKWFGPLAGAPMFKNMPYPDIREASVNVIGKASSAGEEKMSSVVGGQGESDGLRLGRIFVGVGNWLK